MKNNPKLRELAAKMLELAADEFGNHGCNDVDESVYEGWTNEERKALVEDFFKWSGEPEEYSDDIDIGVIGDSSLMFMLADKLRGQ